MSNEKLRILKNTIEQMACDADDKGLADFGLRLSVADAFAICKLEPPSRWIPCSERLPESDEVWQKYIVVYRYRYRDIWDDMGENTVVTVADYCHEQKVWSMDGGAVINALIDSEDVQPWASYITHWMPLPEPPEEELP